MQHKHTKSRKKKKKSGELSWRESGEKKRKEGGRRNGGRAEFKYQAEDSVNASTPRAQGGKGPACGEANPPGLTGHGWRILPDEVDMMLQYPQLWWSIHP